MQAAKKIKAPGGLLFFPPPVSGARLNELKLPCPSPPPPERRKDYIVLYRSMIPPAISSNYYTSRLFLFFSSYGILQ